MRRFVTILIFFLTVCACAAAGSVRDEAHFYSQAGPASEGCTWVIKSEEGGDRYEGKWYLIDVHGNLLTDDSMEVHRAYFHEGLIAVGNGSAMGCIDTEGNVVIPFEWDWIQDFHSGAAAVKKDGLYGLINREGELILPCAYDEIIAMGQSGLFVVRQGGGYGLANAGGEITLPCVMDMIFFGAQFRDGLLSVHSSEGFGYVNRRGEMAIPCQFYSAYEFSEGLARVYIMDEARDTAEQASGRWGFIDTDGDVVFTLPEGCYPVGDFHEGLALVTDDHGQFGYVDSMGVLSVAFAPWGKAGDFHDGRALVIGSGGIGFIDRTGAEVIPCELEAAWPFSAGRALVTKDGTDYLIDPDGCEILSLGDLHGTNAGTDRYLVVYKTADGEAKYGLLRDDGVLTIPCEYDWLSVYDDFVDVAVHETDFSGKSGYMSLDGEVIVPCEYDDAYYGDGYFTLIRDGYLTFMDRDGNVTF